MNKIEREKIKLGQELQRARTAIPMTQKAVAKETDVTTAYISMMEKGKEVPSEELLQKLVVLYDVEQVAQENLAFRSQYVKKARSQNSKKTNKNALKLSDHKNFKLMSWIEQIPYQGVRDALKRIEVMHQNGLLSDETIELLGKKLLIDLEMLSQPRPNVDQLLSQAGITYSEFSPMKDEAHTELFEEEVTKEIYSPRYLPLHDATFLNDSIKAMKDTEHNN